MDEIFGALLRFLGRVFSLLYDFIPNYGIAIILFTIVVNLALSPLTLKQTRSMRAMQDIAPDIKELQRKYKNDRALLQQETMKLYQERGVNPIAGCLPILFQMPIFIALYQVLRNPIGLTGQNPAVDGHLPVVSALREALRAGKAGFLGMDLEQPASVAVKAGVTTALPYFALILIVMGTSYFSQIQLTRMRAKRGQAVPDTPQARQMQMLARVFPFLFGFISYTVPSGLALYFASGNFVRWGIQTMVIRMDQRPHPGEGTGASAAPPEDGDAPRPRPQQGSKKGRPKRPKRGG